jgi:hypothetical protein
MLAKSEPAFHILSGFGHSGIGRMVETMKVYHVQRGTRMTNREGRGLGAGMDPSIMLLEYRTQALATIVMIMAISHVGDMRRLEPERRTRSQEHVVLRVGRVSVATRRYSLAG